MEKESVEGDFHPLKFLHPYIVPLLTSTCPGNNIIFVQKSFSNTPQNYYTHPIYIVKQHALI